MRQHPHDLVVGATACFEQLLANLHVVVCRVDVAGDFRPHARVHDRHAGQSAGAGADAAVLVSVAQADQVARGALRDEVSVDVETADALVQVEELGRRDAPLPQT